MTARSRKVQVGTSGSALRAMPRNAKSATRSVTRFWRRSLKSAEWSPTKSVSSVPMLSASNGRHVDRSAEPGWRKMGTATVVVGVECGLEMACSAGNEMPLRLRRISKLGSLFALVLILNCAFLSKYVAIVDGSDANASPSDVV